MTYIMLRLDECAEHFQDIVNINISGIHQSGLTLNIFRRFGRAQNGLESFTLRWGDGRPDVDIRAMALVGLWPSLLYIYLILVSPWLTGRAKTFRKRTCERRGSWTAKNCARMVEKWQRCSSSHVAENNKK